MKKTFIIVILLWVVLIYSIPVMAADALYRMLHTDEVEQFRADQDAIVVGQLLDKKGDYFTVKNIKVISGKLNSDTFLLSTDFQYGWGETSFVPTVNDYCVISLKKVGNYCNRAWGIFKADSGDYKTLRLLTNDIQYLVNNADVAAIQWYVNSDGKENDFFFDSATVYVRRPNGDKVKIYPDEKKEQAVNVVVPHNSDEEIVTKNNVIIENIQEVNGISFDRRFIYLAIGILTVIVLFFLFVVCRGA